MKKGQWVSVIGITGTLLVSASVGAHDPITTKVTWTEDIARLVEARCVSCHGAGGHAPKLTSYEDARPWAKAIREEVLTRRMPIWHAARGYGEFANDPSLSPFEIALVAAWVDGGAPKDAAPTAKTPPARSADQTDHAHPPPAKPLTRTRTMTCGSHPVSGLLTAVQPQLEAGGSAGIAAVFPDGRREIVAWIRDYDPAFPTTYELRQGLSLPAGARLVVDGPKDCRVTLTLR